VRLMTLAVPSRVRLEATMFGLLRLNGSANEEFTKLTLVNGDVAEPAVPATDIEPLVELMIAAPPPLVMFCLKRAAVDIDDAFGSWRHCATEAAEREEVVDPESGVGAVSGIGVEIDNADGDAPELTS